MVQNKNIQNLLTNRLASTYHEFERSELQYILIVNPYIRALWSLEAAHANPSDVFVFWAAIAATLTDLFSKPEATGIPNDLANKVIKIHNRRYHEFFENEVYFVTFCLDPRKSRFY